MNALDVFQVPIQSWDDLLTACAEITEGKHPFKTVIIDTVDNAYKFCADYILKKFKIEHESDLGYGKGYALINNEFQRVLTKLAFLPCGLFLVSHAKEIEVETRTGKYTRDRADAARQGPQDRARHGRHGPVLRFGGHGRRERRTEDAAGDSHQAEPLLRGRRPHWAAAGDA